MKRLGETLIIHHWDADGIASAALLARALDDCTIQNLTPPIGEYAVAENEISMKGKFRSIIIADLCLPKENILKIKEATKAEVTIFDHHIQLEAIPGVTHVNPTGGPGDWPSTTWVIHKFLGLRLCLPTILGLVGDRGERIRESEAFREARSYMEAENLSLNELLDLAELLDSNHRLLDRRGVEEAVQELLRHWNDVKALMRNEEWRRNLEKLNVEIERQLKRPSIEAGNGVLIHQMSSRYNIISKVARRLAWEGGWRLVIVVNDAPDGRGSQIYFRGESLNPAKLIGFAKARGYSAGGKGDVVGVVLPKSEVDPFLKEAGRLVA